MAEPDGVVVVNVALHVPFAVITKVLVTAVPVQTPDQPENIDPALAAADNATDDFRLKFALQVTPQLIPGGVEVTVPVPVPAFATVSETPLEAAKVADTVQDAVIVLVV